MQQALFLRAERIRKDSKLPLNEIKMMLGQFFTDHPFPEFKFVFCSQLMINQIEIAFANNEVSFSDDLDMQQILEGEKTIIKYLHNFNNGMPNLVIEN